MPVRRPHPIRVDRPAPPCGATFGHLHCALTIHDAAMQHTGWTQEHGTDAQLVQWDGDDRDELAPHPLPSLDELAAWAKSSREESHATRLQIERDRRIVRLWLAAFTPLAVAATFLLALALHLI